jgi:hypothetical protein
MRPAYIPCLSFTLVITAVALAQATRGALETDPQAWIDLMPRENLQGWTRISIPPGKPVSDVPQWKIDKTAGTLVCEGNSGHEWLRYDRELADFIFHVEFRFTPMENGKGYNSGAYVRNSADGKIWHQAQIGGASGGYIFGDTLVNSEVKRINLRQAGVPSRVKPAGEWNTFEISCRGNKVVVWTNGAVTSEYDKLEVLKGYVGLEAEGYRIEFRNVKLKELD